MGSNHKKNKICVVGWYFLNNFYRKMEKNLFDTHIIAHRHHEILNSKKFKYDLIKNIGLEFGAYNYYIRNVWDKKSNVLFMHDDVVIKTTKGLNDIFEGCKKIDYVSVRNNLKFSGGGRCFYLSNKMISLLLKDFGGIWFDVYDRGYIWGKKYFYDDIYYEIENDLPKYVDKIGINFKMTIAHLVKKYNLKTKNILCNKIELYERGENKKKYSKMIKKNIKKLNDNSVFGISQENILDNISMENKSDKIIGEKSYTKWYDFCFSNIRLENLNIIEIGSCSEFSLQIWKNYFINSNIYGFKKDNFKNIIDGGDIVIDTGECDIDRIKTFEILFKKLNSGGIYVLENLQKHYCNKENIIIDYFKDKIDEMNFCGSFGEKGYEKIIYKQDGKVDFWGKYISSIQFYLGMCFIFKRYCQ